MPRRAFLFLSPVLAIALILLSTPLAKGQTSPPPTRDAAAITVLQNSVSAMGGTSGWASIQDWTITGTMQGLNGTVSAGLSKSFSWTGAGSEFLLQTSGKNGASSFVSGHGSPARISNGVPSPINYHVARANPPSYLPGLLLLRFLNESQYTIQYIGTITLNGSSPAIEVHVSDDSDAVGSMVTPQEWYFDPTSFLPLQVDFRAPTNENAADYLRATYQFSEFQPINGILTPFQLAYTPQQAAAAWLITVSSVAFNTGVPSSTFDVPKGVSQ